MAAIIVKAGGDGGFRLPVAQSEVARVDVVDVDLVIQTKSGARYVLPGAGIEAMSDAPPAVRFADGEASSSALLQQVGRVETPDVSIPVMASLTEHDAKDSAGPKNLHGDGSDTPDRGEEQEAVEAQAEARSGSDADRVSPLPLASDATVEKMVAEVGKQLDKLHDKAADPLPPEPFEPQAAPAPGVGAAPNPVSLTPLVVISLGNVVVGGGVNGGGGPAGTGALDGVGVRDELQFATETISGTGGDDVITADGAAVGGGAGHFAKEMAIQISGYFTKLSDTFTVSGLPASVEIEVNGAIVAKNPDGSVTLPIALISDSGATFKLVYATHEYGTGTDGVYETFVMTIDITGVTRGESFHSQSSITVQVRDAATAADISLADRDGAAVYVLPAQGTPNYVDAGAGNDTVYGGYGNDTLIGGLGDDTLFGSYGNDSLYGGAGDDRLDGGNGNDFLQGGAGTNVIDGGLGADTLSYADLTGGVTVALNADDTLAGSTTGGATDTLYRIENVIGSGFGDTITGNAGANTIWGLAGDDTIDGKGGADVILAGSGDDTVVVSATAAGALTLDGGEGVDAVVLSANTAGVTLNLASGITSGGNVDAAWVLNFENAVLGGGNDTVTGTAGANLIDGGAGSNAIYGQGGDDVIRVTGSVSANALYGGTGADTIYGGDGADTLYGDSTGSTSGQDGADTLYGGAGNDALWGSYGADLMDGGTGSDTVNYQNDGNGHRVVLDANGDGIAEGGANASAVTGGTSSNNFAAGDRLVGIENLVGGGGVDYFDVSASSAYHVLIGNNGNDVLIGGNGGNSFDGGGGNDVLIGGNGGNSFDGGGGNDTIVGGNGNDVVGLSSGSDFVALGAGSDIVTTGSGNSLVVVLDAALAASAGLSGLFPSVVTDLNGYEGFIYGADGGTTTAYTRISGVEHFTTTGSNGADLILGSDQANILMAGGGRDTVYGFGGDDTLYGGGGDNHLDGGSGVDTASFTDLGVAVTANLAAGTATFSGGSATLVSIENLIGTTAADVFRGNAGNNVIEGRAGNDTIFASAGNDALDGGDGTDTVSFADLAEGVTADLAAGTSSYAVSGTTYATTIANVENLVGSSGNDTLAGTGGVNTIWGGAGNDTIIGGGGADTLMGGTGADTFVVGRDQLVTGGFAVYGNAGNGGDAEVDTLVLSGTANNNASSALLANTGKLGGIDVIDFTTDAYTDAFTLTAAQVRAIVDGNDGSTLTLRLGTGDTFSVNASGSGSVQATDLGGGHMHYTYYSGGSYSGTALAHVDVYTS